MTFVYAECDKAKICFKLSIQPLESKQKSVP